MKLVLESYSIEKIEKVLSYWESRTKRGLDNIMYNFAQRVDRRLWVPEWSMQAQYGSIAVALLPTSTQPLSNS